MIQARQVIAVIIAATIVALAVGGAIGYSFSNKSSSTSTETVGSDSTIVIVQPSVTTVTVKSYPDICRSEWHC